MATPLKKIGVKLLNVFSSFFRKSLIEISRQINVSARAGWGRVGQWHLPVLQRTPAPSGIL
jgi:DNA-binding Lrp family transcriptional regulator